MYVRVLFTIAVGVLLALSATQAKPVVDQIPVVSQIKSAVQAISGDLEGARKTQDNFSRGIFLPAPIIRSAIEGIAGNHEAARETWKQTGNSLLNAVDAIPVVGHVKGGIHYAVGDKEGGDRAMKASSRTTGVVVGGTVGFLTGGPAGAFAGGVAGGAGMDSLTTGIESAVHKEFKPNGLIQNFKDIHDGNTNAGHIFDTISIPVIDGVTGMVSGKAGATAIKSGKGLIAKTRVCRSASCSVRTGTVREGYGGPQATVFTQAGELGHTAGSGSVSGSVATGSVSSSASAASSISAGLKPVLQYSPALGPAFQAAQQGPNHGKKDDFYDEYDEEEDEDSQSSSSEEEGMRCEGVPDISYSSQEKMADCVGKKVGKKCLVECQPYHEPTRKFIKCVEGEDGAGVWNIGNPHVECRRVTEPACRDDSNRKVDWFVVYKPPTDQTSYGRPKNASYLLISNRETKWKIFDDKQYRRADSFLTNDAAIGIDGPPALDNTLHIIEDDHQLTYVMYSDDPPFSLEREIEKRSGNTPADQGKTKGTAVMKNGKGFYLYHTLPRFPSINELRQISFSKLKGQMFVCISFNQQNQWASIEQHIHNLNPKIYEQRGWETGNAPVVSDEGGNVIEIEARATLRNVPTSIKLFSKGTYNKDIYSTISSKYETSFDVVSWTNGITDDDKLPSKCIDSTEGIKVRNVKSLNLNSTNILEPVNVEAIAQRNNKHSNWAVSSSSNIFCTGDMNRVTPEQQNAGGAVCIQNAELTSAFRALVAQTEDVSC